MLSTNTGAWPSNTAALDTEDEIDGDWGRDSLVMRLLTSESGLVDLGTGGTGEQRFLPAESVWIVVLSGLGLFPLGSGIISRGISEITEATILSVEEESRLCSGLALEDILFANEMVELTSLETG